MNTRVLAAVASIALAVPLVLALAVSIVKAPSVPVQLYLLNWLYMAAPQIVVVFVAWFNPRTRSAAGVALVALTVLLVSFQAWVWWSVPVRESGLAWVLYFPLAVGTILLALLASCVFRKHRNAVS